MKRIRRAHAVVTNPYRHFALSLILDAQNVFMGKISRVTPEERGEAIDFLRGEKCMLWCDLSNMDYGLMMERIWAKRQAREVLMKILAARVLQLENDNGGTEEHRDEDGSGEG